MYFIETICCIGFCPNSMLLQKIIKRFLRKSVSILTVFLRKKSKNFCAQQDVRNDTKKTENYFNLFIKPDIVLISA